MTLSEQLYDIGKTIYHKLKKKDLKKKHTIA